MKLNVLHWHSWTTCSRTQSSSWRIQQRSWKRRARNWRRQVIISVWGRLSYATWHRIATNISILLVFVSTLKASCTHRLHRFFILFLWKFSAVLKNWDLLRLCTPSLRRLGWAAALARHTGSFYCFYGNFYLLNKLRPGSLSENLVH